MLLLLTSSVLLYSAPLIIKQVKEIGLYRNNKYNTRTITLNSVCIYTWIKRNNKVCSIFGHWPSRFLLLSLFLLSLNEYFIYSVFFALSWDDSRVTSFFMYKKRWKMFFIKFYFILLIIVNAHLTKKIFLNRYTNFIPDKKKRERTRKILKISFFPIYEIYLIVPLFG